MPLDPPCRFPCCLPNWSESLGIFLTLLAVRFSCFATWSSSYNSRVLVRRFRWAFAGRLFWGDCAGRMWCSIWSIWQWTTKLPCTFWRRSLGSWTSISAVRWVALGFQASLGRYPRVAAGTYWVGDYPGGLRGGGCIRFPRWHGDQQVALADETETPGHSRVLSSRMCSKHRTTSFAWKFKEKDSSGFSSGQLSLTNLMHCSFCVQRTVHGLGSGQARKVENDRHGDVTLVWWEFLAAPLSAEMYSSWLLHWGGL